MAGLFTVAHCHTTEEEVIDEDYKEVKSNLYNTLSKKAKAQALIIQHFGIGGRANI